MSDRPAIAIVGGGITGLSVALRLEKLLALKHRAASITIFEAADRLGGKIETRRQGDLVLELGAESFLVRKPRGIGLCRDLGVDHRLIGTRSDTKRTFIFYDDDLYELPRDIVAFVPASTSSIASCRVLSPIGRVRMAMDLIKPARKDMDDETLESFLARRFGREAYRRMIEPMLCGIYSGDGSQLSVEATYPQLRELERTYGSLIRGLSLTRQASDFELKIASPFATFPNGMSEFIQEIASRLQVTKLQLSQAVASVRQTPNGYDLTFANQGSQRFDFVVLTGTSFQSADLIAEDFPQLAQMLRQIPHASTATINIWYDSAMVGNPMRGYGFVVPSDQQRFITAVTWTSSKHADRAPSQMKLLRAYAGRAGAELDLSLSDFQILELVLDDLARTMRLKAKPLGYLIKRWPLGSPQYTLGHRERLASIDNQLDTCPRLYLSGASYRGVGIPDCIADAERTAAQIAASVDVKESTA
jgi:oxygen-dependent protoporphyrinogen oxidase